MKKISLHIIIAGLILFALASCNKDDNSNISSLMQDGRWKITNFNDSGTDETYHFTGYQFTFESNGTVSAVNGSSTVNGSYSDGNDDSQSKLVLNFGPTANFDDLNDDWNILEKTSSKIRLEDVSSGGGGTDLLTFEKI